MIMLITCLTTALLACAPLSPSVPFNSTPTVLQEGDILGGALEFQDLVVAAGSTVLVEGGSTILVSGDLLVYGRLAVLGDVDEATHPDLRITCEGMLFIDEFGELIGAQGSSHHSPSLDPYNITGEFEAVDGGRGGSLHIEAAQIDCLGTLRGGDGGSGSPGGAGGKGGSVTVRADWGVYSGVRNPDARGHGIGGKGGSAGPGYYIFSEVNPAQLVGYYPPRKSGDGGSAECHPSPVGLALAQTRPFNGDDNSSSSAAVFACANGYAGVGSPAWTGGDGADGAPGLDGIQSSPDGKDGGPAGKGDSGKTGDAGSGGAGQNCCNGTPTSGGTGGNGGTSGNAKGGAGGKGGHGGDAFQDPATMVYLGNGGKGGNAGAGGDATSGKGGSAGKGGNGCPPGSPGTPGVAGTALPGPRGEVGGGGMGIVPGAPGDPASNGSVTLGGAGSAAAAGDDCCD